MMLDQKKRKKMKKRKSIYRHWDGGIYQIKKINCI